MRQHDFEQLAVEPLRPRLDFLRVRAAARDRDSRRQAPCWKSRSTRQVDGLARAPPLLSSSSAVWIASVVTPAPPTAGMNV